MKIDSNGVSSEYRGTHTRFKKRKRESPQKKSRNLKLDVEAIRNDRRLIVGEFPTSRHTIFDYADPDLGFDYSDVPTLKKRYRKAESIRKIQYIPNENWMEILNEK